jgi:hypothetical protein
VGEAVAKVAWLDNRYRHKDNRKSRRRAAAAGIIPGGCSKECGGQKKNALLTRFCQGTSGRSTLERGRDIAETKKSEWMKRLIPIRYFNCRHVWIVFSGFVSLVVVATLPLFPAQGTRSRNRSDFPDLVRSREFMTLHHHCIVVFP